MRSRRVIGGGRTSARISWDRFFGRLELAAVLGVALSGLANAQSPTSSLPELYASACAACHGADGRGRTQAELAFETPPPDFTDCSFASREPDPDWFAISHQGGPVRAFDRMMPAFGEALSGAEIRMILDHVRTFCEDDAWPRGEFNLPLPLFTEKAFPEDEAVYKVRVDAENGDSVRHQVIYENRFGPRSQVELSFPMVQRDAESSGGWEGGVGDVAVGVKHVLYHDLARGTILSAGGEVILPTGDPDKGFGKDSTIAEPFLVLGKLLSAGSFLQLHAFGEFVVDGPAEDEIALRAAIGRTWNRGQHGFGRAWSPMLEMLVARELIGGADTNVDLVPELQVALSTRQHVLFNVGLRVPVTNSSERTTELALYVLWDWFDGGLFDGW